VATSDVAIANRALQLLGSSRKLESLTQDHPNARSLNAAYEPTRRSLLRRYDWSFAISRVSIASDAAQTTWGKHNRFSLPNNFLRLIRDPERACAPDWRIEGLFIVTDDDSPLEIRYVADVTDPNSFDSLFHEAFANRLAFVTCKEITGSTDLHKTLNEDFKEVMGEARLVQSIEKPAQEAPEDTWVSARR
jgi:hypothetical protein